MTPAARVAAAIEVLDAVIAGSPTEMALTRWARGNRFAGSKDRAAIRDLVFEARRKWRSAIAYGGAETGRAVMLGLLGQQESIAAVQEIFSGAGYGPAPLSVEEIAHLEGRQDLLDAVRLDWPEDHWDRLVRKYGEQAYEIAAISQQRAPISIRASLVKGDRASVAAELASDGIAAVPNALSDTALSVTDGARRLHLTKAFEAGLFEMQDAASQALVDALGDLGGKTVLDFCAGGGGKALAMAAKGAKVTAHDTNPQRMGDLPNRATRAGVQVGIVAPEDLNAAKRYDVVLCDAPCSGSGAWRRTPDGKWNLSEADLERLADVQLSILERAQAFVKEGGFLNYATCSVFEEENELILEAFVRKHPGWQVMAVQKWLPNSAGDGFFCGALSRI